MAIDAMMLKALAFLCGATGREGKGNCPVDGAAATE